MLELPFVFLGGLLGSAHCLGMCGPLALAVGSVKPGWRSNLARQLVFSTGRIFTYATLGASVAYLGLSIAHRASSLVNVQAWLAIASGVILVAMGLATAGVLPRRVSGGGGITCLAGTWLSTLLRDSRLSHAFLAGIFTGFIPCGLVYGFLALAASAGQMLLGAVTMVAFGAGTLPLMVVAGMGGTLLSYQLRSRVLVAAAWCVVIAGMMSIARGAGFLGVPGILSGSGCPFCS